MDESRFTPKELLALRAVHRGCRTNRRIVGATYVVDFCTENEQEIPYYEAMGIVSDMIAKEELLKSEKGD